MEKIYCVCNLIVDFCKNFMNVFKEKKIWRLIYLPITIAFASLTIGIFIVYFVLFALYMLFDYISQEILAILNGKYDKVGERVLVVRNIFGFMTAFAFYMVRCMLAFVLAQLYFFAYIFLFVASGFTLKRNPFMFHEFLKTGTIETTK